MIFDLNTDGTLLASQDGQGLRQFFVSCSNECGINPGPSSGNQVSGSTTIINLQISVISGTDVLTTVTKANEAESFTICAGAARTLQGDYCPAGAPLFFYQYEGLTFPELNNDAKAVVSLPYGPPKTFVLNCLINGFGSCSRNITLAPQPAPDAPSIAGPANRTLAEGMVVSLTATGSCPVNNIYWYSGTNTLAGTGAILPVTVSDTKGYYAKCVQQPCDSPFSNTITITKSNTLTVDGRLIGYIDNPDCESIVGWIADRDNPDTPVEIRILVNNVEQVRMVPDWFRQDAADAVGCPGCTTPLGIRWKMPDQFLDGVARQVDIKVVATGQSLIGGPKSFAMQKLNTPVIAGPANTTITKNSLFSLSTATSCVGLIRWYSPAGYVAQGNPVSITAIQSQTYVARCEQNGCSSPNSNSLAITVTESPACDITVNGLPASNTILIGSLLSVTAVRSAGMSQTAPLIWSGPAGSKFFVQSPTNTTTTSYSVTGDVAYPAPDAIGTFVLRIQPQGTSCFKEVSLTVKPFACGCTDCDLPALAVSDNLSVVHSASNAQNYVAETLYLNAAATEFNQAVSYFDGLGRPLEQVQVGAGGGAYNPGHDIVSIHEYDVFGREVRNYLPYSAASTGLPP